MATLHFDTNAGRETANSLAKAGMTFDSTLIDLTHSVNAMVGNESLWNSANQFQEQFQEWGHKMKYLLDELEAMRKQLDQEIAEWESAASSLG